MTEPEPIPEDPSQEVIALIKDTAQGAREGTIAYILGQGLQSAASERITGVYAILKAINNLHARSEIEKHRYTKIRAGLPADLRSRINDFIIDLAALNNNSLDVKELDSQGYTLSNDEFGAIVISEATKIFTYIFRNPKDGNLVSFSINTTNEPIAKIGTCGGR